MNQGRTFQSMKRQSTITERTDNEDDSPELGVLDILITVAKYKKRILGLPLALAFAAGAVSFAMPNIYRASTKVLPPQQNQSSATALLSQLGGVAGAIGAGANGLKNPNDLYVGMLKSRTIADALIAKYDLKKLYGLPSQEKARAQLEESTVVASGKDGLITIEVMDKNQKLVAQLANSYVDELVRLTKVLAVTEASQRRAFYERQLELAKNNLGNAEVNLKGALDTRGVISVDNESRVIVETVGRLRAQISAKQIQLSSMSAFVTETNPEYRHAQEELGSLRAELAKLENGRPEARKLGGDEKSAGLENIKILRDVKYYQMLYELLAKQYEAARLDEAKDSAFIQVLDPAVEPERKYKPRRAIIVMIGAALGFILAIISAFVSEARQVLLSRPDGAARLAELKMHITWK
jgi:uncharacterized protein involved in exopolysaccharide biosynthesis